MVALSICALIVGFPPKNKAIRRDAERLQGVLTGVIPGDILDFVQGYNASTFGAGINPAEE